MSARELKLLLYTSTIQVREMRGGMEDAANTPLSKTWVSLGANRTIVMAGTSIEDVTIANGF